MVKKGYLVSVSVLASILVLLLGTIAYAEEAKGVTKDTVKLGVIIFYNFLH